MDVDFELLQAEQTPASTFASSDTGKSLPRPNNATTSPKRFAGSPCSSFRKADMDVHFQLSDSIARYQVLVAGHTLDGRIGAVRTHIEGASRSPSIRRCRSRSPPTIESTCRSASSTIRTFIAP